MPQSPTYAATMRSMFIPVAVLLLAILAFLQAVTTVSQAAAILLSGAALVLVILAMAGVSGPTLRRRQ